MFVKCLVQFSPYIMSASALEMPLYKSLHSSTLDLTKSQPPHGKKALDEIPGRFPQLHPVLASHILRASPVLGSNLELVKSLVITHPCVFYPQSGSLQIPIVDCALTSQNQGSSVSAPQSPLYLLETVT